MASSKLLVRILGTALLLSLVPLAAGCSASDEPTDASESSDDIRSSDATKQAEDLFRPDESTLGTTLAATMPGLKTWKIYSSERGITVRGISESGKIKVVFVLALKDEEGGTRLKSMGLVRASDFDLDADPKVAMKAVGEAIQHDLGETGGGGLRPQSASSKECLTDKTRGAMITGGLALASAGAVLTHTAFCIATAPVCVGAIAVLVGGGGMSFLLGISLDRCQTG